jgi:8-oxo-dGTP pyrophosphatase MutT (NUDIX family)
MERILKQRAINKINRDGIFTPAAVMLILKEERDEYSILLIRRSEFSEDVFSGDMALPGGKMKEEDENKLRTAVRETFEETGIDLDKDGRIIGELDDCYPVNPRANHYIVTPFVSLLTGFTGVNPNEEVAEALWIPLLDLKDERTLEIRIIEKNNIRVKDYLFHYRHYVIWGMTARILYKFISLTGHLF